MTLCNKWYFIHFHLLSLYEKCHFGYIAPNFWKSASVNSHSVTTPLTDHLRDFRFVGPFPLTRPNRTDCPHSLTSAGGHRPGESLPVLLPQGSPQCGFSLGKRGYFTPSSWQLLNMEQYMVSVWNCIAYEAWFSKRFIILKRLENSFQEKSWEKNKMYSLTHQAQE